MAMPSFYSYEKGCNEMVYIVDINQDNSIAIGQSIDFSICFIAMVIIQNIPAGLKKPKPGFVWYFRVPSLYFPMVSLPLKVHA
jgi:hypothetical protein